MKEAQLVITIKKLDGCLNMQINGTHGINWPKYFEKAYQIIKSALQDRFEKDEKDEAEEPDAEDVIKHLAGLSKKSVKELKEEFDKMDGSEVEKITKLTIKYLKESLEETLKD